MDAGWPATITPAWLEAIALGIAPSEELMSSAVRNEANPTI